MNGWKPTIGIEFDDKYIEAKNKLLDCVKVRLLDFSKIDDKNFNFLTLEYGVILDHYVERYGIEDYETSVKAIERITQFTTCEFVTHAFIVKYQE